MNYAYLLHPLALNEYNEAYTWYEDKQRGLGERFIKAVRLKIEEIVQHPETYGSRDKKTYREAQIEFFPYLIVYKINKRKKLVHISAIHNTKKNPGNKYRN